MSIFRTKLTKQYVVISNEIAQNNELSLGARGLLVYLLSLPQQWNLRQTQLIKNMKETRYCIEKYMKELMQAGYIHKHYEGMPAILYYEVFDVPMSEEEFKKSLLRCRNTPTQEMSNTSNAVYQQLESTEEPKGSIKESTLSSQVDSAKALRPIFNRSIHKFENLKEEWLEKMVIAFPDVDISQEILRAEVWIMNNPTRTRNRSRWDLFLTQWFQRAQESQLSKKDRSSHSQSNSVDPFAEHKRYAAKVKIALEKHRVKHDAKIYKDAFVDNVNGIEMSFYASFEEFKSYLVRKYEIAKGDLDD